MCVCVSTCVCGECVCLCVSHVPLFVTSWTIAHQAPLSSRQGHRSGSPCPPPGICPRGAAVNLDSERSGPLRGHLRLRERALGRNAKHVKDVNSTGEGL